MLPCVCLFVLLPLFVRGQADVLLSTPSKSLIFPTDQPVLEDTAAPSVPTTTESFANAVTTLEPHVPSSTTSQHALDRDSTRTIVQSTATTVTLNIPPAPLPTSATTAQPTPAPTNATTATTPGPTSPPQPTVGDYVVRAEWNSSACLMAKMGLQFSFKMGDHFQTVNLDPNPNVTKTSGICGNGGFATLVLKSDSITVQFIFANQTSKFFLSALNLTVTDGSGATFTDQTGNLSLWEASLGSSYMCKKEQSFNISDALILNTFELQVQPFEVMNDQFSTAHECSVDDSSLLIPIIVGAALAVLILIVVIAYVIGRRKTYVGYQTL